MSFDERDAIWPFYRVTLSIQRAFQNVFGQETPGSDTVLADLAKYCHAEAPTTSEREAGRRDVWLHIRRRLQLRDHELTALYARLSPQARLAIFDPEVPVAHRYQQRT